MRHGTATAAKAGVLVRAATILVAVVLIAAACGGTNESTSTTTTRAAIGAPDATTTTILTPTSIAGRAEAFGYIRDLVTAYDAGDNGLGRVFVGDQPQGPDEDVTAYVAAVRAVSASAGGEQIDWSRWQDDDLVFFGYLFCLVTGNDVTPETGLNNVTAEVARLSGSPDTASILHFATAVHIVNLASGGLCGEFYLPTREYLDSL